MQAIQRATAGYIDSWKKSKPEPVQDLQKNGGPYEPPKEETSFMEELGMPPI